MRAAAPDRDRWTAWKRGTPALLLFVVVTVFYLPGAKNGFIYDDHKLILEQAAPRHWQDVTRVFSERHWYNLPYYRPVSRLTMVVQKYCHGNTAAPYHIFNAAIMGIVAVLAYTILRLPVWNIPIGVAVAIAILVSIHPTAASTVYPICSGRETSIPTLFMIGSTYAFLRQGRGWYPLALLLLAAALLSKEQAIVLPAVFLLADGLQVSEASPRSTSGTYWFAAGGWVRRYLPVAGIVLMYLLVRWSLFAHSSEHEFAVLQEPWRPLASLAFAIQTTFVPYFELRYEPRLQIWFAPIRFACAVAVVVLVVMQLRKQWIQRWRPILFWLSWIVLSLLPTANIMRQEAMFAERYVFPSLLGTGAIIAMLAAGAWRSQTTYGLAAIAILYCGIASLNRATYYADDQAFLSQWIRSDPQSFQARLSLGEHFFEQQEFVAAREQLEAALRLAPDLARAHNVLGVTSLALGDVESATLHSREAIRLDASDPDNHNNMGVVLAVQGELDAAAKQFQEAIRLQPAHVNSHLNMGKLNANRNRHAEAAAYFRRTIELRWDHVEAYLRLGDSLAALGKLSQAEEAYGRVFQISPRDESARQRLQRLRQRK